MKPINQTTTKKTTKKLPDGQQQNVEIISLKGFIEQTMQTLNSFEEHLKIQLDTNLTD